MAVVDYRALARSAAAKYGVPESVFMAQIQQESGFNPNARSDAGAIGIAQIVPKWHPDANPTNPIASLDYAARWMSQLGRKYGNWKDALSVYNSGKPWAQGQRIEQTKNYVTRILGAAPDQGLQPASVTQQAAAPQLPVPQIDPKSVKLMLQVQSAIQRWQRRSAQQVLAGQTPEAVPAAQLSALNSYMPQLPTLGPRVPSASPAATAGVSGVPSGSVLGAAWTPIGKPYTGTHTLGNWQSDDAVDLKVPVGTPVYALADGTIGPRIGALGSSDSRFAGLRTTLVGPDNSFYYAHLSKLAVKAGQRVRKGDIIGWSGEANGVPHLHLAVMHGDPRSYLGG